MSELESIETLAGTFNNYVELQQHCDEQHRNLLKLKAEISTLRNQISASSAPSSPSIVSEVDLTDGQVICEIQIEKLKKKAMDRELTLEETKRLEILIRSLYLIKEKDDSDAPLDFNSISKDVLAQLQNIASVPDEPAAQEES